MAKTKDIQRRIKSVKNTRKITRAMEMVAASKMKKAVDSALRTRNYANLSWATVLNLSRALNTEHPLLKNEVAEQKPKNQEKQKVCLILITSNRGLCGGFNLAVMNKAHQSIQKHQTKQKIETDFVVIGRKGLSVKKYFDYNVVAEFPKADIVNEIREVSPIAKLITQDFLAGKYSKIMLAYTDFVSASIQVPRVKQVLPVDLKAQDQYLGFMGQDTRKLTEDEKKEENEIENTNFEYLFEPNPQEVLDQMVPRLIEVQLFQALLESNASEHSARMTAMHQANQAAGDLVNELTLFYNKARQSAITSEITEIVSGVEALKKKA